MYPNDLMVSDAEARHIVDWIMTLCRKPVAADDGKRRHDKASAE